MVSCSFKNMELDEDETITLKDAVSREGAFLRDKLAEHFSDDNLLEVHAIEHPVCFDGQKRRIDLILKTRKRGICPFEIFFVIEVKKLNRKHSAIISFGDQEKRDFFYASVLGADPEVKIIREKQRNVIETTNKIDFFSDFCAFDKKILEKVKKQKPKAILSNVRLNRKDETNQALQQAYQGTCGFLKELETKYGVGFKRLSGGKLEIDRNRYIIPVVITTAEFTLALLDLNKYSLETGEFKNESLKLKPSSWHAIKYSEARLTAIEDPFVEQEIFVVNTSNLDKFFKEIVASVLRHHFKFTQLTQRNKKIGPLIKNHNDKIKSIKYVDILHLVTKKNLWGRFRDWFKSDLINDENPFGLERLKTDLDDRINSDPDLFKLTVYLVSIYYNDKWVSGSPQSLELWLGANYYRHIIEFFDFLKLSDIQELVFEKKNYSV